MKVKLLECRVTDTEVQTIGREIEVSDAEGARMCAAGQAVEVTPPAKATAKSKRETATE